MAYHKRKLDILAFLTRLDHLLGRYKKKYRVYPEGIPFLIYLYKVKTIPGDYQNRPKEIFTHITTASWIPQKALYPKIATMDWSYVPSISLDNLIVPMIDPSVVYQISLDPPPHYDPKLYYVPTFITEDYCQLKIYYPDW